MPTAAKRIAKSGKAALRIPPMPWASTTQGCGGGTRWPVQPPPLASLAAGFEVDVLADHAGAAAAEGKGCRHGRQRAR